MNEEFLAGYINLAEGEKDPRNLLLAFAIDRVLLIEFDIKHHVEVRRGTPSPDLWLMPSDSNSSTSPSVISLSPSDRLRTTHMALLLRTSRKL